MKDKHILVKLSYLFSTGFGSGLVPFAPGTSGSIFAFLIAFSYSFILETPLFIFKLSLAILISLFGFLATEICLQNLSEFEEEDPQSIVVDEIAGYFISILFIPWTPINLLLGLILFRIFDITKPGLIKKIEKAPGGAGIMLDDILAGIVAAFILFLINLF
jgi:phosphatidylglycerophosphatase A